MLYSGTDPESHITECTLVYEENRPQPASAHDAGKHSEMAPTPSSLLLSSLELSDTKVYEPYIRALLGTHTGNRMLVS